MRDDADQAGANLELAAAEARALRDLGIFTHVVPERRLRHAAVPIREWWDITEEWERSLPVRRPFLTLVYREGRLYSASLPDESTYAEDAARDRLWLLARLSR